jgi:hypothetical protein
MTSPTDSISVFSGGRDHSNGRGGVALAWQSTGVGVFGQQVAWRNRDHSVVKERSARIMSRNWKPYACLVHLFYDLSDSHGET